MKYLHRITFRNDKIDHSTICSMGYALDSCGLTRVDVTEDDPRWPTLKRLRDETDASEQLTPLFDTAELQSADWLAIRALHPRGYPQPERDFGYMNQVYDSTRLCVACDIEQVQIAPFQLQQLPRVSKNEVLQLNWVHDVFFTQPSLGRMLFSQFGIKNRPVLKAKTNRSIPELLQLEPNSETIADVDTSTCEVRRCDWCGAPKYRIKEVGIFPNLDILGAKSDVHLIMSKQYFGGGKGASRYVFVSQSLYRAMVSSNVSGLIFIPVFKP